MKQRAAAAAAGSAAAAATTLVGASQIIKDALVTYSVLSLLTRICWMVGVAMKSCLPQAAPA